MLAKLYLNHDVYNGDAAADAATFTKAAQAAKIIMDSGNILFVLRQIVALQT